jgi:hypothetical protein
MDRSAVLPAERSVQVTPTGPRTTYLKQHQWGTSTGKVGCGVFDADWANLALGRTRNADDAQRLILAARDGGCAHCGTHTEHTHAHHTTPKPLS